MFSDLLESFGLFRRSALTLTQLNPSSNAGDKHDDNASTDSCYDLLVYFLILPLSFYWYKQLSFTNE